MAKRDSFNKYPTAMVIKSNVQFPCGNLTRKPSLVPNGIRSHTDPQTHERYEFVSMDCIPVDASRPSDSNSGANLVESTRSFHCALRPVVIMAQCFAVFPISGITSPDASGLKFTWRSFKIFYCGLSTLGSSILTGFSIYRLFTTPITSHKTSNLVFFSTASITTLLFLKLAREWPNFALAWENMERELTGRTYPRQPNTLSLATKFKILTISVMSLALVEHSLSILSGYHSAVECANIQGHSNILTTYFTLQFPQIFTEDSHYWKGFLVQSVNVLNTFSWNFMDLFLILISVALTDQFRQLNDRLYSIREKHCYTVKTMPEWWWAEARIDFNRLANMTRRVDSQISDIVLLSFSTNLYFICIQLLNSFKMMSSTIQTIYFCFSFGFLLARTAAVSLYAATIHDESVLPAPILYSVCSASYSKEIVRVCKKILAKIRDPDLVASLRELSFYLVRRFLTQVTTDNISFTGMKFFSITRSLILTVAGTIVTYELVLVQFNQIQNEHQQNDTTVTRVCEVK